jgi:UDP-N-acetylglucosamine:LPS N-acetylglucosamine transferase
MKKDAVILVYGGGGHKEQMRRLYNKILTVSDAEILFIGICEKYCDIKDIKINFFVKNLREKYGIIKTLINLPISIIIETYYFISITYKYNIKLIISTGPGIAIIPIFLGKVLGKKIVFIESWSRFRSSSLTGKIVYYLSNEFFIQNKSLKNVYPKAIYGGLL